MKATVQRSAFTLVELLVVIGIMGLLGSVAVGGYQAMVRLQEESGVMQSVNNFIRAAYQRAQIDRQPTMVYFWNETIRERSNEFEVVVGRAVAVRRSGRLSRVEGDVLVDEFADLDKTYPTDGESSSGGGGSGAAPMRLYAINDTSDNNKKPYSLVRTSVTWAPNTVQFLGGPKNDVTIPGYGFTRHEEDDNAITWKQGMAYGFEFLQLQLPDGFIFHDEYSEKVKDPVKQVDKFIFEPGRTGNNTIPVYVLRENGADLKAVKVRDSDPPDRRRQ